MNLVRRQSAGLACVAVALIVGCSGDPPRELNHSLWMRGTLPKGDVWLEFLALNNSIVAIYNALEDSDRVHEKIEISGGKLVRILRDTDHDGRFDVVFSSASGVAETDEASPFTRELDGFTELAPYNK